MLYFSMQQLGAQSGNLCIELSLEGEVSLYCWSPILNSVTLPGKNKNQRNRLACLIDSKAAKLDTSCVGRYGDPTPYKVSECFSVYIVLKTFDMLTKL